MPHTTNNSLAIGLDQPSKMSSPISKTRRKTKGTKASAKEAAPGTAVRLLKKKKSRANPPVEPQHHRHLLDFLEETPSTNKLVETRSTPPPTEVETPPPSPVEGQAGPVTATPTTSTSPTTTTATTLPPTPPSLPRQKKPAAARKPAKPRAQRQPKQPKQPKEPKVSKTPSARAVVAREGEKQIEINLPAAAASAEKEMETNLTVAVTSLEPAAISGSKRSADHFDADDEKDAEDDADDEADNDEVVYITTNPVGQIAAATTHPLAPPRRAVEDNRRWVKRARMAAAAFLVRSDVEVVAPFELGVPNALRDYDPASSSDEDDYDSDEKNDVERVQRRFFRACRRKGVEEKKVEEEEPDALPEGWMIML